MIRRLSWMTALAMAAAAPAAVAQAAPTFSAMQFEVVCPEFDQDKKPDKDDQPLYDLTRRVYQGTLIGEKDGCDHIKRGKEGWFHVRVTWSSDNNPSLYVESTAAYGGEHNDHQDGFTLFLDGNGSAVDFAKTYEDAGTNIMNEPGLTITVEVANSKKHGDCAGNDGDKDDVVTWEKINQQKIKPTPWALWALHSADSADLQTQLNKGVTSVTGAAPITSTGGTKPVIGLAPCAEGQVFQFVGGHWTCAAMGGNGGAAHQTGIYSGNAACGLDPNALTLVAGCSIPDVCAWSVLPTCSAGCTLQNVVVTQRCVLTQSYCDTYGCYPKCVQTADVSCGTCQCSNTLIGYTMK